MKDKAIQVRCSSEYKKRIEEAAKELNMSVSGYIVMQINKGLKELGK